MAPSTHLPMPPLTRLPLHPLISLPLHSLISLPAAAMNPKAKTRTANLWLPVTLKTPARMLTKSRPETKP
jgi:hypothetical protein